MLPPAYPESGYPARNAAKLGRVEASNIEQVDFAVCPVIQKANITGRVKVVRASIEPHLAHQDNEPKVATRHSKERLGMVYRCCLPSFWLSIGHGRGVAHSTMVARHGK